MKNMKVFISQIYCFCTKIMNSFSKNIKIQKVAHFVFSNISCNTWATETYNVSFKCLGDFVLTF